MIRKGLEDEEEAGWVQARREEGGNTWFQCPDALSSSFVRTW